MASLINSNAAQTSNGQVNTSESARDSAPSIRRLDMSTVSTDSLVAYLTKHTACTKALSELNISVDQSIINRSVEMLKASPKTMAEMLPALLNAGILNGDNVWTALQNQEPQYIAGTLTVLDQAGILNQENLKLVSKHKEPHHLEPLLKALLEGGLLNQENFEAACNHKSLCFLKSILSVLNECGCLTESNFKAALESADPCSLSNVLDQLKEADIFNLGNFEALILKNGFFNLSNSTRALLKASILTQENFEALLNHGQPEFLAKAMIDLTSEGILTPEIKYLLIKHLRPEFIKTSLLALHRAGILNPENIAIIAQQPGRSRLYSALSSLCSAGLLNQSNFQMVLQHQSQHYLAGVFSILESAGLLTYDNFYAVINYENTEVLMQSLTYLDNADIATQNNFQAIIEHPSAASLADTIMYLEVPKFLTQAKFDALIQTPVLSNQQTVNDFWARVPDRRINNTVWQHLINLSTQADAQEAIRAYADQILAAMNAQNPAVHAPNAQAINTNQSTHTASVHASVSASAIKLKEKHSSLSFEDSLTALRSILETQSGMKKEAALRGLNRIAQFTFIDLTSQVSIKQMLCFIHLESIKVDVLIDGLYEIQRGYNLNAQGIDDENPDSPICIAGTFNKLMETLQVAGVEEAQIIFITKQTATLKLQASLKTFCKDHSISEITDENWPGIKDGVKGELAIYRSAFASDAEFESFLEYGQYVAIN